MTNIYEGLAATTRRQITEKGRAIILRSPNASFDPATGIMSESVADIETFGLFTTFDESQIDGTLVRRDDRLVLIAAEGLAQVPSAEQQVIDNGEVWQVVAANGVDPGSQPLLYRLQIRR